MSLKTRSKTTLRPMVDNDIEFLRRLYSTTRFDIAQLPLPETEKSRLFEHQFQAQHVHYQKFFPHANFDIVLSGKTRVGRIYVDYGPTEFRILDISILPEFRGRGLGTGLLRKVFVRAKKEETPVRLRVVPGTPAVEWYEGLGFKRIADEKTSWHLEWSPLEGKRKE